MILAAEVFSFFEMMVWYKGGDDDGDGKKRKKTIIIAWESLTLSLLNGCIAPRSRRYCTIKGHDLTLGSKENGNMWYGGDGHNKKNL